MKDEILTGASALGLAWGGKELIVKLLGPTADYMGKGLKGMVRKGAKNLERIFIAAGAKAGERLNEPGAVPPRVLQRVLQEGPFIEDELAAEYYGGILAASRSQDLQDDVGAYWLGVVQRLSIHQIRMHHICYAAIKAAFEEGRVRKLHHVEWCRIAISVESLQNAFEGKFTPTLAENIESGLRREMLISYVQTVDGFYLFDPTPSGVELSLWAGGYRGKQVEDFFKGDVSFPFIAGLPLIKFHDAQQLKGKAALLLSIQESAKSNEDF